MMTMLQSGEATATGTAVKDTTTQTFVKDVIEESKRQPVLVDFWAEWCGTCKQLAPVLEKAVRAAKGKVKLVKMDIDKHPSIPQQLGIQSIPAVFAFLAIAAEFAGAIGLIVGLGTRVAALGIAAVMAVAITMHAPYGFFMNWFGAQKGEGIEYHLLALAIALALILRGGGKWSADSALAKNLPVS